MISKQAEQAMALLGQGFQLLGPVLSHLVESEKAGTSQEPPCKKKKKMGKRSAENRLRHIQCLKCSKRGHINRDCPN
ncbi:Uncharacterized protein APZ42_006641 [Daphnia magna]|uniref:CCHC-type domain-containing protein n=1 Tax=Daphnia magna TaxID=35525 RepID=A0A164FS84_9CRUS|nr:Uncharacterized protein APZ42_006641 [Daphnia magna]